jgi:hypothetical protein
VFLDLITFGIPQRPWDKSTVTPGAEMFSFFPNDDFEPEAWKGGYPNPSFARMTEADGAWAARVITRFDDDLVAAAVSMGEYTDPFHTKLLTKTLIKRRDRIRERYFKNLSPVADVAAEGSKLCGRDLARRAGTWPAAQFSYTGRMFTGKKLDQEAPLTPRVADDGKVCVELPRVAKDAKSPDGSPDRYVVVDIQNGIAEGPLRAHLYDLGPDRGFKLVGIERPSDSDPTW